MKILITRVLGVAWRSCKSSLGLLIASLAMVATSQQVLAAAQDPSMLLKINGKVVTRSEVHQLLGLTDATAKPLPPGVLVDAVDRLLDRELLIQSARSDGLERQDLTLLQLERARRQLVNQVLLIKQLGNLPAVSDAEVDRFIQQNQRFFGDRKTFRYVRLRFPEARGWNAQRINLILRDSTDLNVFRQKLADEHIESRAEILWKGSEQVDLVEWTTLEAMQNGDKRLLTESGPINGLHIVLQRVMAFDDPKDPARLRRSVAEGLRREAMAKMAQDLKDKVKGASRIELNTDALNPVWAARVNGQEISQLLLDSLVDARVMGTLELRPATRVAVLEELINEMALAQHAKKLGVDTDPAVLKEVEKVKDNVLMARLLDIQDARVTKPSAAVIKNYLDKNPELFSRRRVYRFHEIVIERPAAEFMSHEKTEVESLKSLADIERRMDGLGWVYQTNQAWAGSEEISLTYRNALDGLLNGGQVFLPAGVNAVVMLFKLETFDDPIAAMDAQRIAEERIWREERTKARNILLKTLRKHAQIDESLELQRAREQLVGVRAGWKDMTLRQWGVWGAALVQMALFVILPFSLLAFLRSTQFLRIRVKALQAHAENDWRLELSSRYWVAIPIALAFGLMTFVTALVIWESLPLQELPKSLLIIGYAAGLTLGALPMIWLYWKHFRPLRYVPKTIKFSVRWMPMILSSALQMLMLLGYYMK